MPYRGPYLKSNIGSNQVSRSSVSEIGDGTCCFFFVVVAVVFVLVVVVLVLIIVLVVLVFVFVVVVVVVVIVVANHQHYCIVNQSDCEHIPVELRYQITLFKP